CARSGPSWFAYW
nr:immunoglobulin heavy chain junction region [Mus musculus]